MGWRTGKSGGPLLMSFDRRTVLLAGLGLSGASLFGGTLTARKAFAAGATLPADLVDAAKKEGKLNVITLPRDWADYGELMDTFSSRYGIAIDDANPDGTSAEELQAIRSLKTQSRAPDSVDVGPSFAVTGANEKLFQAYKVATWNEIPDDLKDSSGLWYGDYFGVTSFAVNKAVVKNVPRTWADLLKPEYKGMVAIGGSPLKAGEAFGSVYAAALANGGSFDNIAPGIDFFGKLNSAGNFNPVKCDTGTVVTGQTPIAIKWDYLNLAIRDGAAGKADIDVLLPEGAPPYGNFYCQAISAYAPHPNAAKLWMEYLYSDEGQLGFLKGYAHPIRFNAMLAAGKIPAELMAKLPSADAYKAVKFASETQTTAAKTVLADMWPKLVKLGG
jgi:putative spermidine/putrescine transport system substrate-binding protein